MKQDVEENPVESDIFRLGLNNTIIENLVFLLEGKMHAEKCKLKMRGF